MRRIVLLLWLAAGVASLLHDAITGGGVAGYLLYREIVGFGAIEPTVTYIGVAIPLVLLPAFLLLPRNRGTRMRAGPPLASTARRVIIGVGVAATCALAGIAVLALSRALAVPGGDAPVVRLALDPPSPEAAFPAGAQVILRGTPQTNLSVDYDEVISGKYALDVRHGHTIVPMTEAGWTPDRPVRFLTDLRGATALPGLPPVPWAQYQETSPGVLASDPVPGYLVWALAERGVALAPGARLHTTDAAGIREKWYAFAALASVLACVSLFGGLAIR